MSLPIVGAVVLATLFIRATSGTTWIQVHPTGTSPCAAADTAGSNHGPDEVWCFERAGGDSTWPASPGEAWDHWSAFDPPGPIGNP